MEAKTWDYGLTKEREEQERFSKFVDSLLENKTKEMADEYFAYLGMLDENGKIKED